MSSLRGLSHASKKGPRKHLVPRLQRAKEKARGTLLRPAGPNTNLQAFYLTLMKMMAKVYSAIDSINTSARISMF